jgi:hypothetical protein
MSCNSENTWDQDRVIQLIKSYREKPVLWNPKDKPRDKYSVKQESPKIGVVYSFYFLFFFF